MAAHGFTYYIQRGTRQAAQPDGVPAAAAFARQAPKKA